MFDDFWESVVLYVLVALAIIIAIASMCMCVYGAYTSSREVTEQNTTVSDAIDETAGVVQGLQIITLES